jgi:hypothetical protein
MNNAVSLKMHRADFQFGSYLITGRVKELEMHGGGPATETSVDLRGEIFNILDFRSMWDFRHGIDRSWWAAKKAS